MFTVRKQNVERRRQGILTCNAIVSITKDKTFVNKFHNIRRNYTITIARYQLAGVGGTYSQSIFHVNV